jgi:hypothetical protein
MARTVTEIQQTLTDTVVANMAAAGVTIDPTTWSATNLIRVTIYVRCFLHWFLESLFDVFTADVDATIATLKPHTTRWYAEKSLAFQYGFALIPDTDEFDDTGHTDTEIENSKIVDYAAVVEQPSLFGRLVLRIKLAHDNGTDLEPVTTPQKDSFTDYMNQIKDAGVPLIIDSLAADSIRMQWKIFYDPLLIDSTGAYIDGSSTTPVKDAIKNYLKQLPFNGVYVPEYHNDFVEAIKGVVISEIVSVETQYGLFSFKPVVDMYTPDAGYLRFDSDSDLTITFIPQSPIR